MQTTIHMIVLMLLGVISGVTAQDEGATTKAQDLVASAVARAARLQPQDEMTFPVTKAALVVGGGIAGIQSAMDLADQAGDAQLVETLRQASSLQ